MLRERIIPADIRWKGNRRKRGLRLPVRSAAKRADGRSLDSFKLLATSEKSATFHDEAKASETYLDRRRRAYSLYSGLLDTLKQLAWLEAENRAIRTARDTGKPTEAVSAPRRRKSREWRAAKDLERISGCQSEWIGYKPDCCGGRIQSVPVNCNHRLCPLCNAARAERYRGRVQKLFGALSNPQLLTLTVPSPKHMSRMVLDTLRTRLKAFLRDHKALLQGGVYSIEVTYNRRLQAWHPHVHILVDVAGDPARLPYAEFLQRKLRLEFAWLVLTQGKRRAGERTWAKGDFDEWARNVCGVTWTRDAAGKLRVREQWSAERAHHSRKADGRNRRVIDLRPVAAGDEKAARKSAYEVLKYMAKAASFVGQPGPLAELLQAVRGVRQIQTFGTCYAFKLDDERAPTSQMQCDCGTNDFRPIGRLGLGMVELCPDTGRWYVRRDAPLHGRRSCRGGTTCNT